jgi:two-component system OmpR family response regulator
MIDPSDHAPLLVLIEDAPEVLSILRRRLATLAPIYQQIAAPTGWEILAQLAGQVVALAIVDYHLPGGMDGLAVIAALKGTSPHMRTVLMTASPTDALEANAYAVGVDAFLVKPFTLDELDRTVRALLVAEIY